MPPTIGQRIAGALGMKPAAAPARVSAQARALGAIALEHRTPRNLVVGDFAAGSPVVGARSVLARHTVPRGDIFEVALERPIRAYLKALFTVTDTSDSGGDLTIDLGAEGLSIVRSTRPAATAPFTTGHPDVIVYATPTAGGARAVRTVDAVDFDAGTIDVSGLGNAVEFDFEVFYLSGDGELRIRASQPSGVDERTVELYNNTLAGLHETDQADGRTAPRIVRPGLTALPLGPKWTLSLEVDSPARFSWVADAGHEIRIQGHRIPVSAFDERQLSALIGQTLLNG